MINDGIYSESGCVLQVASVDCDYSIVRDIAGDTERTPTLSHDENPPGGIPVPGILTLSSCCNLTHCPECH